MLDRLDSTLVGFVHGRSFRFLGIPPEESDPEQTKETCNRRALGSAPEQDVGDA